MQVLMFGWEFPPHISGGLGTACYGLTSSLIQQHVKVIFVVPKLHGEEDKSKFTFINASDVIPDLTNSVYLKLKFVVLIVSSFNISNALSFERVV